MIENSMFYMDFEISSEQQRECIEKIKEAGSDDVNGINAIVADIYNVAAAYDNPLADAQKILLRQSR